MIASFYTIFWPKTNKAKLEKRILFTGEAEKNRILLVKSIEERMEKNKVEDKVDKKPKDSLAIKTCLIVLVHKIIAIFLIIMIFSPIVSPGGDRQGRSGA